MSFRDYLRRHRRLAAVYYAPKRTYYAIKRFYLLGTRGWYKTDAWNLDTVFTERLGRQLLALDDYGNGYPGDMTPETWSAELRHAAYMLLLYAEREEELDLIEMSDPDWIKKSHELEAERLNDAKAALHWVADHLQSLWD